MHCIEIQGEGEKLSWRQRSTPPVPEGYALIDVEAAGVNRADLLQRKGLYPPPEGASDILGLELAGEVAEINGENTEWEEGDRVMTLVPGGAYATQAVVPLTLLLPIPDNWSFTEAAAVPEAIYTSYYNLIELGNLSEGEQVLIHAGAGGIGTTALQLAKQWQTRVCVTAGTDEKINFCKELGADAGVNYTKKESEQRLREALSQGVDVILDPVGGSHYVSLHLELLNPKGRWQLIGLLGGLKGEVHWAKILQKNLKIQGATLRDRPLLTKQQLTHQIRTYIWPWYEKGLLQPVVDRVFLVKEVGKAHKYMKANKVKGKIVLQVKE
jgi:putative PIG3 family NAD(P)H quinone oxidoreductase